jgi:hypothetical protein
VGELNFFLILLFIFGKIECIFNLPKNIHFLVSGFCNGNKVSEFTTTEGYYSIVLNAGQYSVSEVSAPSGYVLSSEVIYFELTSDGILKVKNNKGEYVESAVITFYNTPKDNVEVVVPNTRANNYGILIAGVALILGGIAYARKTIKEC